MENVKKKRKTRGPPPFLRKVYEFVDDPNTNKIISWGPKNQSIIIWDQFEFSETILPKYFTHKNFSSFIYQLNSYGFRKIDPDRREYANEWFRAGEMQLLCNIKRREPDPKNKKRKEVKELPLSDPKKLRSMEAEIEDMKREYNEVQIEIQELRKNQESIKHELVNNKPKEENEMLDLFLNSFAKSQENFKNNNDDSREEEPMTSDVQALLFLSLLQEDVLGEEDLTHDQSKTPLELKEMITKISV